MRACVREAANESRCARVSINFVNFRCGVANISFPICTFSHFPIFPFSYFAILPISAELFLLLCLLEFFPISEFGKCENYCEISIFSVATQSRISSGTNTKHKNYYCQQASTVIGIELPFVVFACGNTHIDVSMHVFMNVCLYLVVCLLATCLNALIPYICTITGCSTEVAASTNMILLCCRVDEWQA